MAAALVRTLVALGLCHVVAGDAFTRIFVPLCPLMVEPAPTAFLRWSDPQTWAQPKARSFQASSSTSSRAGAAGAVPGVGAAEGCNVTIPCGVAVLLDVPRINVTHLDVQGLLRVEDPTPPRNYSLLACFVTVEGRLAAGTAAQHLRSRLQLTLQPNPLNRTSLLVQGLAFPDKLNRTGQPAPDTANVGHKAFAVVGGQVDLHGMPGGGDTPAWSKLAADAGKGETRIRVQGVGARQWPVGSLIALASTSFFGNETEQLTVTGYGGASSSSMTELLVSPALRFSHQGDPLPDGFGGWVDQCAEVGLLSRNIVVTGQAEDGANALEGGHLMIVQTQTAQVIEGVELLRMGQQGKLGRYPLHFHLCGDTGNTSLVSKNSIHQSMQRCVVVHATHNLTVQWSVSFNTSGHCFLLEEGGEQGNTFLSNLGMLTFLPRLGVDANASDRQPALFWMTNLNNHFIGNVAAGSASSGFWPEVRGPPFGMSASIPELRGMDLRDTIGGRMEGNVAHSNGLFGFQSYPHGMRGRLYYANGTSVPYTTVLSQWRMYKNPIGLFARLAVFVSVTQSVFADNVISYLGSFTKNALVERTLFVGQTANRGPLPACKDCSTVDYSKSPPFNSSVAGNTNASLLGVFGVSIQKDDTLFSNCRFSKFVPGDLPSAAFTFGAGASDVETWFTAVKGAQVDADSTVAWFPTFKLLPPSSGVLQTEDLGIQDLDGSLVGGTGGFILSNSPALLPPTTSAPAQPPATQGPLCSPLRSGSNSSGNSTAYACVGVSYRRVLLQYAEERYGARPKNGNFTLGDYSFVELTRSSDGARRTLVGNLFSKEPGPLRTFFFLALANQAYTLAIRPPRGNASWWPASLTLQHGSGSVDVEAGDVAITVLPRGWGDGTGKAPLRWSWVPDSRTFYSPCPGATPQKPWPITLAEPCLGQWRGLQVTLTAEAARTYAILTLVSTTEASKPCSASPLCGVLQQGSTYYAMSTGAELHATPSQPVGFESVRYTAWRQWPNRRGILGYNTMSSFPFIPSPLALVNPSLTFYFRTSFNLTNTSCYRGIAVHYFPVFGLAVYLNGLEAFRYNLPSGQLRTATPAFRSQPLITSMTMAQAEISLASRSLQLNNGINYLAFEAHAACSSCGSLYFDSQISLQSTCSASTVRV